MSTRPSIVVMGVAGCGKSSLGAAVASVLRWPLIEGEAFHPPANVAQRASGHHGMAALVDSRFEALERPCDEPAALTLDATLALDILTRRVAAWSQEPA